MSNSVISSSFPNAAKQSNRFIRSSIARAGGRAVKLYINDFNIIEGEDQAHQDDYVATIRYLVDEGAPVDGVGLQGRRGRIALSPLA